MQENRLDTIKKDFVKYLISLGISQKSLKNYRSDLNHFLAWIILTLRTSGTYIQDLTDSVPFLSPKIFSNYKLYLLHHATPVKTVNRRLSSLRHLAKFLFINGLTSENILAGIENVSTGPKRIRSNPLITGFRQHLESQKVAPNTIKNYLSDINQFIAWLDKRQSNA